MADERVQRRLAAILAADVVGYSRLIEADEEGTRARLRSVQAELIDPQIAADGGRIVKTMGDGILAEFPSAVDAVRNALAIQAAVGQRNADAPQDTRLEFRVGINVGDIIVEGDDIHGDGVNVAARLEGLCEPGGVYVSGTVYDQAAGKLAASFEDLGAQSVKNIAKPVRVYRAGIGAKLDAQPEPQAKVTPSSPDKPSIAVLPFDNMSGDPEQEFFADGLAEDIITALSKIERMRVIARNSSFAYKGQALDLRRIAEELGVRYVLEGSVRRGGERLRITAQLIDAEDGSHLWAERYDRTVDDLFDIQDEITKEIVTSLRVKLTDGEEARVWARGTDNIEAWQFSVRAWEIVGQFSVSHYLDARALAEKATELDPQYAHAWAMLGFTYWFDGRLGYTGDAYDKYLRADELAKRAMVLDETGSSSIGLAALVAAPLGRPEEGVTVARKGSELHPSNADVRFFLGYALTSAEHYGEAVETFRAAMSLNPFCPNFYRGSLARALICLGEFDEALALLEEVLKTEPTNLLGWVARAAICGQSGREAEAQKSVSEIRRLAPNLRISHLPGILLVNDEAVLQRYSDGVRKGGLPE
ncbi:MAG: tetratricopeptide repeat protein [Alphaproteobacteria bacterium]|nr:tetratricopeptide repeat protein [Alphaproteobacteria bacterium]